MDQREFNKQMSAYLRDRKEESTSFIDKIRNGMPRVEVVKEGEPQPKPDVVSQDKVEAVMRGEQIEPQEDYEQEPPRRGWLREWLESLFPTPPVRDHIENDEYVPAASHSVDNDVKEMLRICVKWVNRLPADELQEIRRSDEYHKFKTLLDKYGLVKKK